MQARSIEPHRYNDDDLYNDLDRDNAND